MGSNEAEFEEKPQEVQEDTTQQSHANDFDLLGSLVLFCFSLFVVASGIYMCFFAVTGTQVWYYSPGFFPLFIGTVLTLLSVLLFRKKYIAGGRLGNLKKVLRTRLKDNRKIVRLVIAIGLFALYVFVLLGRIPFLAATFLYLSATMTIFRENKFAIWKILVISALSTGAVYVFFKVIASVPLP